MADNNTNPILSVCATTGERVKELTIKDGQLIFVQDKHRIALDFNGKRTFYNILPQNIVVIHDDMDLPTDKIKAKIGGGSGGHNGIKSIDF